ncbi:MAG: TlpA family protein disulfide reductase [Solirubrobacteraceae bacterium]|nr:TlpA family protein disulfide reductase [Solirubrobacteraceae bacterium]
MRTALLFAAVIAVGAAIGIGLKQASSESDSAIPAPRKTSADEMRRRLAGSPAPLAALHAQAGELLPGGRGAWRARLRALRGHPAVVNVWASWCGPCRQETPVLQEVSLDRGREVAFIGVNLRDDAGAARRFLRRAPVSYPSYEDPDGRIYNDYGLAGAPATIFYDARGRKAYTHQGPYLSTADLERDIARYAGGAG